VILKSINVGRKLTYQKNTTESVYQSFVDSQLLLAALLEGKMIHCPLGKRTAFGA